LKIVDKLLGKSKSKNYEASSGNSLISKKLDNWLGNFDKKLE
jgi:hypothetical protein